ncbi:replicative DNA helicase [Candidatus Giovannonibacteria bacterium RIFCSPHIGHO2_01_FULL_48_47]|nr:MAG: replicative DNA helicase [Candidatus Giovannonibacteria bacterium RIFCSPHIGHO2_01_FULL_48_47]OGF67930.1 MAG: replicative DNA helicase [Candidatus Giovannonibacteria bacterium RIFCSPHIGHO2_02_FULL_48_15]OGF88887.1 MAG: replicative DNA helicase [Candidatus Giovannonibacteria bacterium RIFCSPLOWO2_01_FULL_48_47]OGF95252.1 MAG: replicative DNA helicase [Candidatus Giovannonibacteria bacterium RIFOXYC1_FULL_48_8]OGF96056.1 MAG: replicative DNA helicase [Candidatus Giovannonibacteria bacteriu
MANIESPLGSTIRIPPQNVEAEISTLGALLLDGSAIYKVADIIRPEDFYRPAHQTIFSAILDLFDRREPIDMLSISSRLGEKNILEQIGGVAYLTDLVNSVPTASNVQHYAELVRKKRVLRDLIQVSGDLAELGYRESEDIDSLLDEAEKKVFSISQRSLHQKFTPLGQALEEAWERIDNLHKNKGELRGVSTGFKELDNILAGLQKSDLVILAARPSFGKTALALDIARHVSIHKNIPVGIFSLEMSTQQLVDRFIASEAHVDLWKLRTGRLAENSDDFARIRDALDHLSKAPLYIDDEASNNILQMRAMARRLQADHGNLGLLVIDYLQLMQPRTPSESMVQQITEISRSLKALARELNVPVLAVSQLSRAVESRHPPIPRLSDLRESGSIEQDADVVLLIHREDRYRENSPRPNQADIMVAKHRNGPLGKVSLYFNPDKVTFTSLDESAGFENFAVE